MSWLEHRVPPPLVGLVTALLMVWAAGGPEWHVPTGSNGLSLALLVLVVELLNSAIEAVVDRVSLENHRLAKRAKDIASAAVLLSLPWLMYQMWAFVAPGLYSHEKKLVLPLVVVYLCILYAYMGKIILTWTLPQGWVTILIMAFSVIGMLAMLLVHPFQQLTEHAWIKVITKNYYRSLLPLLVLQYVAIFTRISDYGFTSARWAVVAVRQLR